MSWAPPCPTTSDRLNVHHLPVLGSGAGGCCTTVADMAQFWPAVHRGAIVAVDRVREALRPISDPGDNPSRYGLGFWLHPTRDIAMLHGYDAGASFRSVHDPARELALTVMSKTSDGTWPVVKELAAALDLS